MHARPFSPLSLVSLSHSRSTVYLVERRTLITTMSQSRTISSLTLVRQLWSQASLPECVLENTIRCGNLILPNEPSKAGQAIRSSFQLTAVAQACAAVIGIAEKLRTALISNGRADVSGLVLDRVVVDARHAIAEWKGWTRIYHGESQETHEMIRDSIEADSPEARKLLGIDRYAVSDWDELAGLYRTHDHGWVRIHTNFPHHKLGILQLLKLAPDTARWNDDHIHEHVFSKVSRQDVQSKLDKWQALEFEHAAQERGLCVTAYRSRAEWSESEMGRAVKEWMEENVDGGAFRISRIASTQSAAGKVTKQETRMKVIDMSRVIAGPICTRTLAAYGADVLLLSSRWLPNLPLRELETARGKRTAFIELPRDAPSVPQELRELIAQADVVSHAYRPNGLAERGLSAQDVQIMRPGIIYAELRAFGFTGPWQARRAYDSLTQTACGINYLESLSHGSVEQVEPKALPLQALDYAAGSLMCFAILACRCRALLENNKDDGWKVQLSLASTAEWIMSLGQLERDEAWVTPPQDVLQDTARMVSAYSVRGLDKQRVRVLAIRHAAVDEDNDDEQGGLRWTVPAHLGVDRVEWV